MTDVQYTGDFPPHGRLEPIARADLINEVQANANWVKNLPEGERGYFAYRNFSGENYGGLDFSHATMAFTNCVGTTFQDCIFKEATFRGANLNEADLTGCNLSHCNFIGADLTGINLTNTKIYNTLGNGKEIKNVFVSKFVATYTSEYMNIGCMYHDLAWWQSCTLDDILAIYSESDADYLYGLIGLVLQLVEHAPCIPSVYD